MSTLHEPQIGKARKIVGYVLSILASLLILFSGLSKIAGTEEMVENMSKLPNFIDKLMLIGVLELVILALYWIPKTSNIGFFLLASYAGGIIVGEIVAGDMPIPGMMVATLFYLGTMLRKPALSGLGI